MLQLSGRVALAWNVRNFFKFQTALCGDGKIEIPAYEIDSARTRARFGKCAYVRMLNCPRDNIRRGFERLCALFFVLIRKSKRKQIQRGKLSRITFCSGDAYFLTRLDGDCGVRNARKFGIGGIG